MERVSGREALGDERDPLAGNTSASSRHGARPPAAAASCWAWHSRCR